MDAIATAVSYWPQQRKAALLGRWVVGRSLRHQPTADVVFSSHWQNTLLVRPHQLSIVAFFGLVMDDSFADWLFLSTMEPISSFPIWKSTVTWRGRVIWWPVLLRGFSVATFKPIIQVPGIRWPISTSWSRVSRTVTNTVIRVRWATCSGISKRPPTCRNIGRTILVSVLDLSPLPAECPAFKPHRKYFARENSITG